MSVPSAKSKTKASTKMKTSEDIIKDAEVEKRKAEKKAEKKAKMKAKLKEKKAAKRKLEASKVALKAHLTSSFDIQSEDFKLTSPHSSKKTKTSTIGSVLSHSLSSKKTSSVPQTSLSFPSLNSNFKIPKKQVPDKEISVNVQERVKERKVPVISNERTFPVNVSRFEPWPVRPLPVREPTPEIDREANYAILLNSLISVQHWLETSPCPKSASQNVHRNTIDTHSSVISAVEQEQETPMIIDSEDVANDQVVHKPSTAHPDLECSLLESGKVNCNPDSQVQPSLPNVEPDKVKIIYVILDTNVLANDLMIVDDLKKNWTGETGTGKVVLVVPWVVLQELDMLKDDKMDKNPTLKSLASNAVRYLHDLLSSKHPQIMGQPIADATESANWALESNDDRILQCCLQCKSKGPCEVILFTNDRNLCNKALVNGIQAHSKETITQAIDKIAPLTAQQKKMMDITFEGKPDTGNQLCNEALDELKTVLHDILETILKTEMYVCYGDMWLDIILIKPPWRLLDILKCYQKHWIAVFGNIVIRKAKEHLDVMFEKFKVIQGAFNSDDLKALLVASLRFLMYFEGRSTYKDRLKPSIHALRNRLSDLKNVLLLQHQNVSSKKALPVKELPPPQKLMPLKSPPLTATSKGLSEGASKVFSDGTFQQSSPFPQQFLLPGPVPVPPQPIILNQRVLPIWPVPMPDTYVPDAYTPPPQTTTPVPMSNSTFSSGLEHKNVETDSETIIQNTFQSIWGFINQTCGMLLDSFKLNNPIEYERPPVIPTENDSAHFIPRLFPVITKLKKAVESVLQLPDTSGPEEDVCLELCYLLENFFVILDMSSEWKLDEDITPEMLCNFYKNPATREMLTKGYHQLEEYCTLVYFIVMNVKDCYQL